MADRIELRGLRVLGVHGALPDEQVRAQPFEIDLDVDADLSVAGRSDHLDDTVDHPMTECIIGAAKKPLKMTAANDLKGIIRLAHVEE